MRSQIEFDAAPLPVTALLSQVLVAFIIEFDNEFERQAPHRTTTGPRNDVPGPWLASMAGWSFMRLVGAEGVTIREHERQARAATLPLLGMQRWGYVYVAPDPADKRPKPPKRDWLIRPTPKGSKAREIWRPLFGVIEDRWQQRFGTHAIAGLRNALEAIVSQFDFELPDFLPILVYGLFATVNIDPKAPAIGETPNVANTLPLPALLAKTLLAITLDFERQWPISLPIFLDTLRILDETGVPQRNLPRLAGVSKEAIGFTMSFLRSQKHIEIVLDPKTPGTKLVRLTAKGAESKAACQQRLIQVEESFRNSYGQDKVEQLRMSLMTILEARNGSESLLGQGLIPHPEGWRASKAYIAQTLATIQDPAGTLPHYPMVLHRGGFPDGS
jgi:DNA-binding MarR family transcriptional regulator